MGALAKGSRRPTAYDSSVATSGTLMVPDRQVVNGFNHSEFGKDPLVCSPTLAQSRGRIRLKPSGGPNSRSLPATDGVHKTSLEHLPAHRREFTQYSTTGTSCLASLHKLVNRQASVAEAIDAPSA